MKHPTTIASDLLSDLQLGATPSPDADPPPTPGETAVDKALDRALSRDSRAFLKANRQTGGQ